MSKNKKEMTEDEKRQYEATWLWRCSDAVIAEECTRYSYVYATNDPLMNKLAVLFEANCRILKNQFEIKKLLKKIVSSDKRKET